MMKLMVLGSGTSVPHPHRAAPAFWLETDCGNILLDCAVDTAHRMAKENLAIGLTEKHGTSLVYTSDTSYSEDLARFAAGANLLIMEFSFPANKPTPKHLDLAEAMRLAQLAAPCKLLLTHFYPEWDGID